MKPLRNNEKRIKVKVTNTEISNSFIKIKTQHVESDEYMALLDLKAIFKSNDEINNEDIALGDQIYIARLDFDHYARCRIVEMNDYSSQASIVLIDTGFKIKMNYSQLRVLPKSASIYNMPSISKEYILAELIISREYDDYRQKFSKFDELVVNKFLDMEILNENNAGKYVQLYSLEASISHDIIPNHPTLKTILKRIYLAEQMSLMLEQYINESFNEESAFEKSDERNFKELSKYCSLEEFPLSFKHEVRISAYENGPYLFYVQSTKSLSKYQEFHVNLQKITLQPLKSRPNLSDICLAFLESNNVQRVEITEIANNLCKVRLIDHGFERMVDIKDLYEMPENVRHQKPFAWKFSLNQIEKLHFMSNSEINFYFQYITIDKRLYLYSQAGKYGSISCCTLLDDSANIYDVLKAFNPRHLRYPQKTLLSDSHKVKIVYADSPKLFFVNICGSTELNQGIFEEFLKFNSCTYRNPSVGSACYVKINNRNCRGNFQRKINSSICKVELIDIGIVDDFSCNEIKIMVEKFTKIPPLAYKCCLIEFKDTECDKVQLKNFITKCQQYQTFNMKIVSDEEDLYYVTLENENGKNIADELSFQNSEIEKCNGSKVTETLNLVGHDENSFNSCNLNIPDIRPSPSIGDWTSEERREWGEKNLWDDSSDMSTQQDFNTTGIITSILSPNDFTIQCSDSLKKIEVFLNELQETAPDEPPLTSFVCSTRCTAKNSFTNRWCRAIILDAHITETSIFITVRDLDNGTIFSVDDVADLKKASFHSLIPLPYGIRCGLPLKIDFTTEDEATRLFSELNGKEIRYKLIACNEYINVCDIIYEGRNISDYLVKMEVATKLKIIPTGTVYVVYVKNLKEFYVHLKNDTELINNMARYLHSYEHVQLKVPVEGLLVLAKSKEFNKYFRAKIKSIDGDDIEVKFIDFGNTEKVTIWDLGLINEPWILKTPPLAHRCLLNLATDLDPDSVEAIDHFRQIAKNGYQEITARMIQAKLNSSVVELYIMPDEKNILDELSPLCKKLEVKESFMSETAESSVVSEL